VARLAVALGVLLLLLPVAASAQDAPGDVGVRASFNVALPTLRQPLEARAAWLGAPGVTPAQAGARSR